MSADSSSDRRARVLGIDAGGTMTDTIIIDDNGHFVIGKAQTTPDDESVGFEQSALDALHYWGLEPRQAFGQIASGIFSGTSMLNRLLERKGQRVGLIVTRGMEDYLRLERGVQTHLGYSYADSLHVVTHRHHEPLVPLSRIRGVGGRIDATGLEAIPLYEDDARTAIVELLAEEVECICVNLLFCYVNPAHERRIAEIAAEEMEGIGRAVPLYLASELYPKRLDFPRLNTLLIEAYAAEPSRKQLSAVRATTKRLGASFELRVMAGFGGTISVQSKQLVNTLVSGPIGGVVGARYLAELTGETNVACSDIGGTSFDVALITNGDYEITSTPDIAHFKMNFPMIKIDSIGAGTGSFVRVNRISGRIEIGPDGAGARIGISNPAGGLDTVTITDCNVVLGVISPDYFLGGDVPLERERALAGVGEQIAEPLGLSVEAAASGVIELFEDELKRQVSSLVMGKGFEPADFVLLGYGGGGPLHVGGYTDGLNFQDVLVPSWAAGFSAFGCACADFSYRFDRQVDIEVPPDASDAIKSGVAEAVNAAWERLSKRVAAEFEKSAVPAGEVDFTPYLRVQYMGQVNDIEVPVPLPRVRTPADVDAIIAEFERVYGKVYAGAARSPELGYLITLAIVTGSTPAEKPVLPNEPLVGLKPSPEASKGTRQVYWQHEWIDAEIHEMDRLAAGNVVPGLAVIEAPSTTFVVPPGRSARLDQHRIFHLDNRDGAR
jgi:N-methylhydantoinase A/acetone carboxylase beta subunit